MSNKETADGRKPVVNINIPLNQVVIRNPDSNALGAADAKTFSFDAVYDDESTQRAIYEETAYPLVESVLTGYNGTIFAYGQTGCGKTHTMQGKAEPAELRGVIPNSFDHIFDHIKVASANDKTEFLVRCSYLEIYNEEIRDLLSHDHTARLELHENPDQGVYVKDLTQVVVDSAKAIDKVMNDGNRYRTTGATLMNETSSRSHSIFTIIIEQSTQGEDGKDHIVRGKLNLVDLAGSERAIKTGATGARLKEGIKINLSLTALGNVISALVDQATTGKAKHIPYRDSKLTRLLQDSLGGNTKTVMVAAVGPADYNYDETLSTLRYANRAKNIKNKPSINEDPKDALLRQYKDEIDRLKRLLVEHLTAAGLDPASLNAILASAGGTLAQQMKAFPSVGARALPSSSTPAPPMPVPVPAAAAAVAPSTPTAAASREGAVGAQAGASGASGQEGEEGGLAVHAAGAPRLLPVSPSGADRGVLEGTTEGGQGSTSASEVGWGVGGVASGRASTAASEARGDRGSVASVATGSTPRPVDALRPSSSSLGAPVASLASSGGPATGSMDTAAAEKHLSDAIASALPKGNGGMTVEATEAIEAARREADKERKEREELARKLLALQQMVVGGKPGGVQGGPGNATLSPPRPGAPSAGVPSSQAQAFLSPASSTGSYPEGSPLPALSPEALDLVRAGLQGGGGPAGGGAEGDPELVLAMAREESRREQALARAKTRRQAAAAAAASEAGASAGMDGPEEAETALFGDALKGGTRRTSADGDASTSPGTDMEALSRAEKERLVKRVRGRYLGRIHSLQAQLGEQAEEWSQQRESMASTIREQAKEAKLLEALVSLFLSPSEMGKVWERAMWSEESEEWTLPRIKPRQGWRVRDKMAGNTRQPLVSAPSGRTLSMGSSGMSDGLDGEGSYGSFGLMDRGDGTDEEGGAVLSEGEAEAMGMQGAGGQYAGYMPSLTPKGSNAGGQSALGRTRSSAHMGGSSASQQPSASGSGQPGRAGARLSAGSTGMVLPALGASALGSTPGRYTSVSGNGGSSSLGDGGLPALGRKPSAAVLPSSSTQPQAGPSSMVMLPSLTAGNAALGASSSSQPGGGSSAVTLPSLNLNLPGNIQLPGLRGMTLPAMLPASSASGSSLVLPDLMVKPLPPSGVAADNGGGGGGFGERSPSRAGGARRQGGPPVQPMSGNKGGLAAAVPLGRVSTFPPL